MLTDLHIHTAFSCDSKTTMEEYCKEALEQGIKYLCFTDHVDHNRLDAGYGFYKPDEYFEEFNRVQDKYSDRVTVLSGIEFSEPHVYRKEFERISNFPYDFILGSIHYWINGKYASMLKTSGMSLEEAFEKYWMEVYKAVSFGRFDSLAHMDFPKRYYEDYFYDETTVYDIFKVMVKNDISLEINTSSLRKGLTETMPGKELLTLYEKAGGVNITVGSDAHASMELAKGYSKAIEIISPALVNGYYEKRKFSVF